MASSPDIRVEPASALVDEDVIIWASGLEPHSEVTLLVQTQDRDMRFYSYGCYQADGGGQVKVCEAEPSSGTYTGTPTGPPIHVIHQG